MIMREERVRGERGGVKTAEAIYVDLNGNQVREDDPRVHSMAYAAGAIVSPQDARRYGLARTSDRDVDARERKRDEPTGVIDAAEHRRAVDEIARLQGLIGDRDERIAALTDDLARAQEELSAMRDDAATKAAEQPGKETKPAKGAESSKPADTGKQEGDGAKRETK